MLCQECRKADATFHLAQVVNGVKQELHLCADCAGKKGLKASAELLSVSELLSAFAGLDVRTPEEESRLGTCPACGLSYREFRATGLLGCDRCYEQFRKSLVPLLRRIHGSNRHRGRGPRNTVETRVRTTEETRSDEMVNLRRSLADAIRREEFEEAARLRDLIGKTDGAAENP